jgi:hypothetical protein
MSDVRKPSVAVLSRLLPDWTVVGSPLAGGWRVSLMSGDDPEPAAALADRLEQAERDKATIKRVSDALDDAQHSLDCVYMNTSFDAPYGCDCTISHIWRALDGTEADR